MTTITRISILRKERSATYPKDRILCIMEFIRPCAITQKLKIVERSGFHQARILLVIHLNHCKPQKRSEMFLTPLIVNVTKDNIYRSAISMIP